MEMPKGWKRLSEANGNIYNPDPYLPLNTEIALDLMKEMAEALDEILHPKDVAAMSLPTDMGPYPFTTEELTIAASSEPIFTEQRKVLERFKEWK